jgi:hypothetical protein
MQKRTQNDLIIDALEDGNKLTGLDIFTRFNCISYKDRIWELRKQGYAIKTEWIKTKSGKRVALYSVNN